MSSFSFTRDLFLIYGASLRNVGNANKRLVNDTVGHRLFLPWRQNRQIIAERGCTAFNTHWSITHKHSSWEKPCSRRAFKGQISSNNRTRNPGDRRAKPSCVSRCQKPPGVSKSCTDRTGARYQAYIDVRGPGGLSLVRKICHRRGNEKLAFRELALSQSEFFRGYIHTGRLHPEVQPLQDTLTYRSFRSFYRNCCSVSIQCLSSFSILFDTLSVLSALTLPSAVKRPSKKVKKKFTFNRQNCRLIFTIKIKSYSLCWHF